MAAIAALGMNAGLFNNEVTYTKRGTTFALVAQKAQSVNLNIYAEGTGGKPVKTVAMRKGEKGVWKAEVKGDLKGRFYTFNVKQDGKMLGETPGLFAKAVGVNGKRGAIIDMAATNPEGWESDRALGYAPTDFIVYESHNRDFSVSRKEARYPGKFMALTEPWAIEHLKSLGVTAIHLLPSFDYASVDEEHLDRPQFNWGYDPLNYNVPEGSYSTNPFKPEVRVKEFKQMVKALHDAGIAVILDVVYNHTMDIHNSNFQRTNPDVFYRKNDKGEYSDGSGCGNETASEHPLMRQYMIESFKYWADEYHLDGFRVDLMGVHDIATMNLIRESHSQECAHLRRRLECRLMRLSCGKTGDESQRLSDARYRSIQRRDARCYPWSVQRRPPERIPCRQARTSGKHKSRHCGLYRAPTS